MPENEKIKVRKYKKQDKTESGASRPIKGHLFTVWELKQDKSVAETSARTRASSNSNFHALHMSMNDCESTRRTGFELPNQCKQVGEFESSESTKNEDQLYVCMLAFPN